MNKKSVYVIGDSISMHYGPFLEKMLDDRFVYDRKRGEGLAPADLDKSEGANGGDSSNVLDFLKNKQQLGFNCDILLLNCGLHDIKTDRLTKKRQVEIDQYEKNLASIAKIGKETAKVMIWVSSTHVSHHQHAQFKSFDRYERDVEAYNKAADKIMKGEHIKIIDLYTFTLKLDGPLLKDGVHFFPEISRLQAAYIAGFLNFEITDCT